MARKSKVVGKPGKQTTGQGPVGAGGGPSGGGGSTRKHQGPGPAIHGTTGSGGGPKHSPRAKHNPKQRKRRYTPGSDVDCCAAEALTTLRWFAGEPVSHEDTLALYWRTARDADTGATILDTLRAADVLAHPPSGGLPGLSLVVTATCMPKQPSCAIRNGAVPMILGVTLPEPHAIAVDASGRWWSWGEPFNPLEWPELEIEEAWEVIA